MQKQKLGIPPPPPPITTAPARAVEAIKSGNLSEAQIAVLDELFPVADWYVSRAARGAALAVA
jgi:hypothetical protein